MGILTIISFSDKFIRYLQSVSYSTLNAVDETMDKQRIPRRSCKTAMPHRGDFLQRPGGHVVPNNIISWDSGHSRGCNEMRTAMALRTLLPRLPGVAQLHNETKSPLVPWVAF